MVCKMRSFCLVICLGGLGPAVECQAAPPKYQRAVLKFEQAYLAKPDQALPPGATFEALLRTGKKTSGYEVVGVNPGKAPGTVRSVSYRTEKVRKQDLQLSAVIRLWVGGKVFDVLYEPASKAYVLLDVARRDEVVNERLQSRGQSLWSEPTDAEQAAFIEQLKEHTRQVGDLLPDRKFQLHETQFFLIYSDMPTNQFASYAQGVDGFYQQMCTLYGVYPGQNIWAGKCLLVAFSTVEGFQAYDRRFRGADGSNTAPTCYRFQEPDGRVVLYGWTGGHPTLLKHALYSSTAGGFLYRYRSNATYDYWIQVGINGLIAGPAAYSTADLHRHHLDALNEIRKRGDLGGMLAVKKDPLWHHTDTITAGLVLQHLHKKDPVQLRALLTMAKEGYTTEEALQECFGLTPVALARDFGATIGFPNLGP